jgi:alkylhydroperoxidase family enzyme
MSARINPAQPPFGPKVEEALARLMPPGIQPLVLFTTLARDERLFQRFMAGGLLDKGRLTLRQREFVINRTTALCGSAYEFGVHVALFSEKAGFTPEQIAALAGAPADASCWSQDDRLLLSFCESLHRSCDIDDALWAALRLAFSEEALLELLMLAGFYRTVAYLTNALRLPPEPFAAPFPAS